MSWDDHVEAARLALPDGSLPTGITRIQQLGLDFGARFPLHFVVPGDHHAKLEHVFLHRTLRQPMSDEGGVTPAAAFVECSRWLRTVDLIKVGDWLLHHDRMTVDDVLTLAAEEPWRAGSNAAAWALAWLDGAARSLPESELRTLMTFSGLPTPEVNSPIKLTESLTVLGDLWLPSWRVCIEYEGSQHQSDRDQYVADIDRYRLMRRAGIEYALVTKERLRTPRQVMREIHDLLVGRGYRGPSPDFGVAWESLFGPVPEPRLRRRRRSVA